MSNSVFSFDFLTFCIAFLEYAFKPNSRLSPDWTALAALTAEMY